jgi:hypothetical protein
LSGVVAQGARRPSLESIRGKLAEQLELAEGRDAAILAKELRAVIAELDALPTGRLESRLDHIAAAVTDDLAARRAARQPEASGL